MHQWIAISAALCVLVFAAFIQSQTYLNHDVAWVLYSSQRLLDGGTFGHDIIAANPPLIWWLSAVPSGLARIAGLDPVFVLRATVTMIAAVSLWILNCSIPKEVRLWRRLAILVGYALLVGIVVDRDFGQREHITVLLTLPWLIVVAGRVRGDTVSPASAFGAGLIAGLGLSLKPHFLAVVLFVELFLVVKRRTIWIAFRPETLGIAVTGLFYIAAVWFFARPYLTEVLPQVSATYWGFNAPVGNVLKTHQKTIIFSLLAFVLAGLRRFEGLPTVFALASLGFLVAGLAQSKGYSYHFYPVKVFAVLSLLCVVGSDRRSIAVHLTGLVAVIYLAYGAIDGLKYRSAQGAYGVRTACLVDMVQRHVPENRGFLALSTHPYPGFPVTNYSGRQWLAYTNSRLYLPAVVHLRAKSEKSAEEVGVLVRAEAAERDQLRREMGREPGLVFVDVQLRRHAISYNLFDYLAFYLEDEIFAGYWSRYQEVPSCTPDFKAYVLRTSQ